MIKNKKIFYTLIILTLAIIGLTTATAVNTENSTNHHDDTIQQSTTTPEPQVTNTPKQINKKTENTTKKAKTITITNQTYTNYFKNINETFIPRSTNITEGDTINLQGRFENTDFVIDKKNIKFTSTNKNAQLYNCTIYIQNGADGSTISNMDIYNTNKEDATGIFVNYTNNLLIENNHVIIDDCEFSFAFAGSLNNSIIRSNYFETLSTNTPRTHTSCVLGKSFHNLITNNTVKSDEADGIYISTYGSGRFSMAGQGSYNNITYNNLIGGNGTFVNLIQTDGNNNRIQYNNVTGGFEGIVAMGTNTIITNNQVKGPIQYGMDIQSDAIITNNTITVYNETNAIRLFQNIQLNNNNISSENGYCIYLESGDNCCNFTITDNKITTTNSIGIHTKGIANHINIENNQINTKQEGIHFAQQSITKRANNILVNNNNITTQTDYAINFNNAGSRTSSYINITVTDTNILKSKNGIGLHTSYLPPTNNKTITKVRTQIKLEPIETNYATQTNITATIHPIDMSTINNGNIIFTNNKGQQVATAQITNNKATITTQFTDLDIKQITAKYLETENYTTSQNTTTITIKTDNLLETLKELTDENTQLKDKINQQNKTINDQNTQINTLHNKNNELTKENNQQKQDITNYQNQINTQNNKIQELNNKLNTATNTIKEQNIQINTLNNKINTLTTENTQQNEKIKQLNTQINNLNNTIKQQNTQINNLNQKIKELTSKQNTKITIKNIPQTKYSNYIKITGNLTDNNNNGIKNQIITIKINNKEEKTITDNKGTYTLNYKTNTVGTNNITIKYETTEKYNPTQQNTTFKVQKQGLNIKINKIKQTKYDENITINGTLQDDNKKGIMNTIIRLKINNKTTKIKTTYNGTFTYTTKATKIGTNNITITYPGNKNYKTTTTKTTLQIKKQNTKLTINPITPTKYGNNITITGTLTDNNHKKIKNTKLTIKTDKKTYTTQTDKNGNYKITLKTTNTGTNNITITYKGTTNYNKTTTKTTYTVNKQDIKIDTDKITKTNNKITIQATIKDTNNNKITNNKITITINNKTKTIKTNNKGIITYTINTKDKKFNIKYTYNGNNNYNKYKKTTTITT